MTHMLNEREHKMTHVMSLYYYTDINRMIDENGFIVDDIFRIISPWLLERYKDVRGTYYIPSKTDVEVIYELVFPLEGDEMYLDYPLEYVREL